MPGNAKPAREHSRSGKWQHRYNELKKEHIEFKVKVAQYQGAVHELAVSATKSSRRVGMLTQTILACRKHFDYMPHEPDCESIGEGTGSIPEPCSCGKAAILESIDKTLAEPDYDPGTVKVEIKDDSGAVVGEVTEVKDAVTTDAPRASE